MTATLTQDQPTDLEIAAAAMKFTKQELLDLIVAEFSGDGSDPMPRYLATEGKSLPREFFVDLARRCAVPSTGSMPTIARRVVETFGWPYRNISDSSETKSGGGSTVTRPGLYQILVAVSNPRV